MLGTNSVSRQHTAQTVAHWLHSHPQTVVEYLDLALDTPKHFSVDAIASKGVAQATPTQAQRAENAVSERLVSQFLAANVIVVGAPLYNFSVPTKLKSWIDRLSQPGRTFKYNVTDPVGLTTGKTVIEASSRGGIFSTTEGGQAMEHQESYLKVVFGFFGLTDVRIVRAEGVAMGEVAKTEAFSKAQVDIAAVAC